MKRLFYLVTLCSGVIVLGGCRNPIALPYSLTIVTGDKLGNNPTDKLPQDIKTLCAVAFEDAEADTGYYPEPQLKRVGAVNAVVSLTTVVEDKFAARKSNAAFMNRCIKKNLDEMPIGPDLAKENSGHINATAAAAAYESGLTNTLILDYATQTSDSVIGKRKIYRDMDELGRVITKALHANRSLHVVVNYNLPAGLTSVKDTVISNAGNGASHPITHPGGVTITPPPPSPPLMPRSRYDTVHCKANQLISKYDPLKRVALEGDILVGTWVNDEFTEGVWYDKNWHKKEVVVIGRP